MTMAPIFYCTCTNCACSATVLHTQRVDMEGEGNRLEEVAVETNRTANCENNRTGYSHVEYTNEESQAWEIVESIILLFIGAALLFGKDVCMKTEITIHKFKLICF